MSAKNYPVTFPYGVTTAPYSKYHPHRGNDRACPVGTPVVIGSTTIGLTGQTGWATGPHLHIQEWSGSYANTRNPRNEFKGGKVINIDPNGTQGDGSFGKFISIQTADGWIDSYCHLSQINVKVGQVISESTGSITKGDNVFQTDAEVKEAYMLLRGNPGTAAERKAWIGQSKQRFFQVGRKEADAVRQQLADVKKALANEKAKPPKTVIKEVEKIVEKPIEKIIEVRVGEEEAVRGFFGKLMDLVFKKKG